MGKALTKRFELIVFDWDGTLLDSAAAIVHAIQAASADLGLPVPTDARARHVIGLGLSDALHHAVPELPVEAYPQMVERYRHHYLSSDHELTLFDGTVELNLGGAADLLGCDWLVETYNIGTATGEVNTVGEALGEDGDDGDDDQGA